MKVTGRPTRDPAPSLESGGAFMVAEIQPDELIDGHVIGRSREAVLIDKSQVDRFEAFSESVGQDFGGIGLVRQGHSVIILRRD